MADDSPFYKLKMIVPLAFTILVVVWQRLPFVIRTLFHSFENIILHAHFTNVVLRKKNPSKKLPSWTGKMTTSRGD